MKKLILCIYILTIYSSQSIAVSKRESLNKGSPLIEEETMFNAGTWHLYMEKCQGVFYKEFRNSLAKLSWPDLENYSKGLARYGQNYTPGNCSKSESNKGVDFFSWIIRQLENKTGNLQVEKKLTKTPKKEDEAEQSIETRLVKLKSLFTKKLITQEEYDAKRKDILNDM